MATRWRGRGLVVGAAALAIAACGTGESDSASTTPEPTAGAPTTSAAPTTTVAPTTSATSTTTPPTTEPATSEPAPVGLDALFVDVEFEAAGIPHRCIDEPEFGQPRCTQVVHDPWGVPVSWDADALTLTRHAEDGTEAVAVLDASFTLSSLVAAGPDQVVYLDVVLEPGAEGWADLVAVSLAPGDAGRVIERAAGAGNPGVDFDFVVTPAGISTTGWYGAEPRPDPAAPVVMAWVDRDPEDGSSPAPGVDSTPNGVDDITIQAYEATVTVNGRSWQLNDEVIRYPPTGMPPIERTFDGGFIARYDEVVDEYRSIIVRGWPDGTVTEWIAPPHPNGLHGVFAIPEPMGTVLVASGDRFVRLQPFGRAPVVSEIRGDLDVDAGLIDTAPLNDHLAGLDWTVAQPPWDTDAVAFADAAAGPVWSPAELRTITVIERTADAATVVVTDSGFLDDSIFATRRTMTIAADLRSVERIEWAQRCQPNRGHQTFEAALLCI